MKHSCQKVGLVLLLAFSLILTGCPFLFDDPDVLERGEVAQMIIPLGAFGKLVVHKATSGNGSITIFDPSLSNSLLAQTTSPSIIFNGFQQDSGEFTINNDFVGENEFVFPITGSGNEGCIDFTFNGCDASDVGISYSASERTFQITSPFPAGLILKEGVYAFNLVTGIVTLADGPGDSSDIQVTLSRASQPVDLVVPFAPGLSGFMTTLPVGEVSGLRIVPTVVVANPNPVAATARIDFFDSQTGEGQALQVNGGTASTSHDFQLAANASARFELSQAGPDFVSAWGMITANVKGLKASVVYSTFSSQGTLLGEAGVATANASMHHVMDVDKTAEGFDTAFAVLNPTNATAELRLTLKDSTDNTVVEKTIQMAPRNQISQFFLEAFGLENPTFSGSLIINCDAAVAVNTLRTLGGFQTSSLEAATP